jgi:3-oxoacyl-[acyl-carrier protein] reductase
MEHEGRRVALITGASRGIGRGIALRMARDGFDIAFSFLRDESAAASAAAEIRHLGRQAWFQRCEMGEIDQVKQLVANAHDVFGRLDVFVNNAGGAIRKAFGDITPEDYDWQFGQAKGCFFAMQEASRLMQANGRIVVITSAATRSCPADAALYAGAKMAMEAFARCLSRDLSHRGITVNVVAPGATKTDLLAGAPAHIIESVKRNSFGRMAEVDDIADVVSMISGPDARWITGQILRADGGL